MNLSKNWDKWAKIKWNVESTELWRNVFAMWANEKKQKKNLEEYDNETFDKNCWVLYRVIKTKR